MATEITAWTPERVLQLKDESRGWPRYECIGGELLVTPAPRPAHYFALDELGRAVDRYVRTHGLGWMLCGRYDISLDDTSLLEPDLLVIPSSIALPIREWGQITELLLVVEVLSPSTAWRDRGIKRRHYQRAGVPEYWIVDLDARLVERWRPGDERPEIIDGTLVWRPDPAIEPLEIPLPPLFDEVERLAGGPEG